MFAGKKSLFLKKKTKTFGFVKRTYYLCADKNENVRLIATQQLFSKLFF